MACCGTLTWTTPDDPAVLGEPDGTTPIEVITVSPFRASGTLFDSGDAVWITGASVAAFITAGVFAERAVYEAMAAGPAPDAGAEPTPAPAAPKAGRKGGPSIVGAEDIIAVSFDVVAGPTPAE